MMAAPALALPAEPAESKQPATTSTTTMKQPQPKSGVYQLDDEWTQDIEYNPESFVKEYPKLKKLLETFALNPVAYTADIIKMINKYQEKPELLDPHLQEMCDLTMRYIQPHLAERDTTLINDPQFITHCALQIIYTLSIVRGYKTVIRYLPHEVSDLEPTLHFLLAIDQQLLSLWYSRYVLCIWLSIIVRVPFNLHSIDSFGDLIDKILTTVKAYLGRSEKAREGAAVLVSRLFSRPDFEQTHMKDFFEWALDQLEQLKEEHNIFLFTGIFRALAEIFKHAHRDALLPNAPLILERAGKIWSTNKSRVVRKYATKLIQRIAWFESTRRMFGAVTASYTPSTVAAKCDIIDAYATEVTNGVAVEPMAELSRQSRAAARVHIGSELTELEEGEGAERGVESVDTALALAVALLICVNVCVAMEIMRRRASAGTWCKKTSYAKVQMVEDSEAVMQSEAD